MLDEISPYVERLKIKGCDSQYTRFYSIILNFSWFENRVALSCNEIFNLTKFVDSLESLLEFDCSYTSIIKINDLPTDLKTLICSHNCIESLDHLPNSLQMIDCCSNQLQELCHLPVGLFHLKCQENDIALIDNIPSNPSLVDVSGNPIIHLRNLSIIIDVFLLQRL